MTAFGTAVGMLPIALERAIGLERLSPLAITAIGGLMVSTFLTLLYVPIFYTIFEDGMGKLKGVMIKLQRGFHRAPPEGRPVGALKLNEVKK